MKPEFIMLIGFAGCGKSTWVRDRFAANPDKRYTWLSSDRILEEIMVSENITYNEAHQQVDHSKVIAKIFGRQRFAFKHDFNIIRDQTNLSKSKRDDILKNVPSTYHKIGVFFDVPMETILLRQNSPERLAVGKTIPSEVMERMLAEFDKPESSEFDEFIIVT